MSLEELIERAEGRVQEHAPFGERTTYRVGGGIRGFVTLSTSQDLDELGPLFKRCALPIVVVGNGSNLLVADGEVAALGVHLTGEFTGLTWRDEEDDVVVRAGAGLDLPVAARRLAVHLPFVNQAAARRITGADRAHRDRLALSRVRDRDNPAAVGASASDFGR